MQMKGAFQIFQLHKLEEIPENKSIVSFAYKWAEAMESKIPYPCSKQDVRDAIKASAYETSAEADIDVFIKALDILVECWRYGDLLKQVCC